MTAVKPFMREWAQQAEQTERDTGDRPVPAPSDADADGAEPYDDDDYNDGLCFWQRDEYGEPLPTPMDLVREWNRAREQRLAGEDNPSAPERAARPARRGGRLLNDGAPEVPRSVMLDRRHAQTVAFSRYANAGARGGPDCPHPFVLRPGGGWCRGCGTDPDKVRVVR